MLDYYYESPEMTFVLPSLCLIILWYVVFTFKIIRLTDAQLTIIKACNPYRRKTVYELSQIEYVQYMVISGRGKIQMLTIKLINDEDAYNVYKVYMTKAEMKSLLDALMGKGVRVKYPLYEFS